MGKEIDRGVVIYALSNDSGNVFYIGRTKDPSARRNQHKKKYARSFKMAIIQDVFVGETPAEAEQRHILAMRDVGHRLDNVHVDVGQKHDAWVKFRLYPDEKAAFSRCASASRLNMSAWVRLTLRDVARARGVRWPGDL